MELFNDDKHFSAGTVVGGTPCTCTFSPGETLTGDLTLSGNGIGTRLGYIHFKTSLGNTCECGDSRHDHYIFASNDGFLAGIFGQASDELDQLGVFLWKPIAHVSLEAISYPTLSALSKVASPTQIVTHNYCNDNSVDRTFESFKEDKTVTTGFDSCFTASASFTFGETLSVEGKVPMLEKASAGTTWSATASLEFKNCKKTSDTDTQSLTYPAVTLKPHTRSSYVYAQYQGKLNALPYNAVVKVTFTDGGTWTAQQSGTYTGTSYTSLDSYFTGEESGVNSCPPQVLEA